MTKQQKLPKRRFCRTPLQSLWNNQKDLPATKLGYVTSTHIEQLMAKESVSLVIASAGYNLQWHVGEEAKNLWLQVKGHICNEILEWDEGCSLEDFPGSYFFYAVEWRLAQGEAVIVLEQQH